MIPLSRIPEEATNSSTTSTRALELTLPSLLRQSRNQSRLVVNISIFSIRPYVHPKRRLNSPRELCVKMYAATRRRNVCEKRMLYCLLWKYHNQCILQTSTGGDMSQLSDQTERIFLGSHYLDTRPSLCGGADHQWARLPEHESFSSLARAGCRWQSWQLIAATCSSISAHIITSKGPTPSEISIQNDPASVST